MKIEEKSMEIDENQLNSMKIHEKLVKIEEKQWKMELFFESLNLKGVVGSTFQLVKKTLDLNFC